MTHHVFERLDDIPPLTLDDSELSLQEGVSVQMCASQYTRLTLNIFGWKSGSTANSLRSSYVVSDHQSFDVSNGKKWSLVFWLNGRPMIVTGR